MLKQHHYTGSKLVIPSALANVSCADLGVDAVFEKLNAILGPTSHERMSVSSILERFIALKDDFGTVYAHLHRYWVSKIFSISDMEYFSLPSNEHQAQEILQDALAHGKIRTRDIPCRRIWDLRANRVVLWQATPDFPPWWGISHVWVDERDRVDMCTPINRREWPVPMPKDANLDLIRIEMFNLGAEYVWLDVLCLRQEGGLREDLRVQEWKIDVPTIGSVYARGNPVVCYFSGLGLPLRLNPGYFQDDRFWFKRAWTLQEISEKTIIAGETDNDKTLAEDIQARFRKQLASLRQIRQSHLVLDVLSEMKNRVSTKPLDKVAGLGYILDLIYLPVYDGTQSEEDAWEALVDAMIRYSRWDLLFFYPEPGDGSRCWRPSWNQIMTKILPSHKVSLCDGLFKLREYPDDSADSYQGYYIDSGYVRGLSNPSCNGMPREGELVIKRNIWSTHTFKIIVDHTYPIPTGSYTLLFRWNGITMYRFFCVVGQRRWNRKFKKLSVFRMQDDDNNGTSIWDLGILKHSEMVLC